jgi:hypothetical protein
MRYLAEFYLPSRATDLKILAARARRAAEQASRAGPLVQFITAIHAAEDESCFVIYEAATPAGSWLLDRSPGSASTASSR